MRWYRKISADPNDLSPIPDAVEWFQEEYEEARKELQIKGQRIDAVAATIPGLIEYRFAQLQELETILKYLEEIEKRKLVEKTKWIMENYPRAISETVAKQYAQAEQEVFDIACVKFEVATVRNNFLALFKGIEAMHYQIKNIVDLRKAGLDDATF